MRMRIMARMRAMPSHRQGLFSSIRAGLQTPGRRRHRPGMLLIVLLLSLSASSFRAAELPATIDDRVFWTLFTDLSETAGQFPLQFMSNEDSAQFVIPQLKQKAKRGGVFIGVGSEQNFTYIATLQPRLAFVVDIRRDNAIEHLMYKALFEMSANRADFVSRLFARRRPAGLSDNLSAEAIFNAFQTVDVDPTYYDENLRAVLDRLSNTSGGHGFPLSAADRNDVGRMMNAFRTAGPFSLKGFGDPTNPTYAQLMSASDLDGVNQSYLANEENFRLVRELESQNRVIPLVGDFAGTKAISGIGRYLKDHESAVDVFYVSNVERYLFEQGDHGKQFYANVRTLPLANSSLFVRSVTSDISIRLGIPIPESRAKWRTFLFSIDDCLKALADGRIQSYRDLIIEGRGLPGR